MITRHDIAFMVQEIISECHSRPKGAEMIDLIDKYADKFGKDNNQCETIAGSSFKFLSNKEEDIYTFEDGKPIGKDNNEFGHSGDKTVSSYPEDNQQPPKERKVSLEEIKEAILIEFTLPSNKSVVSWLDRSALAILSLLNAKESTEKK